MKLIEIASGLWKVRVVISKGYSLFDHLGIKVDTDKLEDGVFKDLYNLDAINFEQIDEKHLGKLQDWLNILNHVVNQPNGPRSLNKKMCHEACDKRKIDQISKNGIRFLYFVDGNKVIINTHCFIKGGGKTPEKEKRKADNARQKYLAAKTKNPNKYE